MNANSLKGLWQEAYLAAGSDGYLENLYEIYLSDPQSIDPKWRAYFDNLDSDKTAAISHQAIQEQFKQYKKNKVVHTKSTASLDAEQEKIYELIAAFRRLGHLQANIDPLGFYKGIDTAALNINHYGFAPESFKRSFNTGLLAPVLHKNVASLEDIYSTLKRIYCGSIGFEYMHINRSEEVNWIRDRIEQNWATFNPTKLEKKRILNRLIAADGLEKYLGFKYVGQKRFSLEGGDSLIPLLDVIVNHAAENNVKEIIIGMAHRGRLNVLANIVGQDPKIIFSAFEGTGIPETHSGDVKYHLGCSSNVKTANGSIHLALAFNPSHLEIVSPVVQGSVRSRQRRRKDTEQQQVLPIQIHGDAAFAGQGVVMETFNMSQARWFKVGGSIHIVINNQLGFTISNPQDARSTTYCTDIAKMVEAPILHVNANDPEAAYFAALFAIEYRRTFKRDVVIDLVCYRRHGHNESDEPSATQPLMYKKIKSMPVLYQTYGEQLIKENIISEADQKKWVDDYRTALDEGKRVVEVDSAHSSVYEFGVNWKPFFGTTWSQEVQTAVPLARIKTLAKHFQKLPEGFAVQPQVNKMLAAQKKMIAGELSLNWGCAETLAYATLLDEGYPIRLCGQDAGRGTFAHRHAVLHDQNTDEIYIPLSHVSEKQAQINIVDSLLSEEAVLAFEYGYATAEPNYLAIWEAQFGDFANGAQVVIDQFISSGEQKWGRFCGLVMLLPHGYEGQGPEHSSARLERYLQLCSQDNIQVCIPTTPAQIFHILRRQMLRPYRKPLIIMSPKSVLRNPLAVSNLGDLTEGQFEPILDEIDDLNAKEIKTIIFCTGKVYYELLSKRREQKLTHVAIIRIEQLYPTPIEELKNIFTTYTEAKDIVWCQEEPQNQGSWIYIQPYLSTLLTERQQLRYAGRRASASPAVGYHAVHESEQEALVAQALTRGKA